MWFDSLSAKRTLARAKNNKKARFTNKIYRLIRKTGKIMPNIKIISRILPF